MLLPGGMMRDGERLRAFAFRRVDGALEAALADATAEENVPRAVTGALAAALAELGGDAPTFDAVRRLPVGDRQFLARQLSAHLGRDAVWLTAVCGACGEPFDFEIRQSELPVKEAGEGFPYAEAGPFRLRVPTGADQEVVADLDDEEEATRLLFARCRVSGPSNDASDADDEQLAAAEEALEAVAPEVALAALANCPSCGKTCEVAVYPYLGLRAFGDELFEEVHRLAANYHWSEAEILALSRHRRQLYLRLIDRSRGVAQ
jgi:transcription elongation factor Elf1